MRRAHCLLLMLAVLVLVGGCPDETLGQAQPGPGFDPTPLAIPKVPEGTHRPITSLDLLQLRDLHGLTISPDGKYVAFVVGQAVLETNSYRTGLFVMSTSGSDDPVNLGTAGPPRWWDRRGSGEWLAEPPQWSIDSQYIYYRLKNSGTWQVWRWNRRGGMPVQLTHAPYDVQSFELSPDGTKVVLTLERPRDVKKSKQIEEHGVLYSGGTRLDTDFHPWDRKPIVEAELERMPADTEIWLLDTLSGDEKKATTDEINSYSRPQIRPQEDLNRDAIFLGKTSPDGKQFAYVGYGIDKSARLSFHLFVRAAGSGQPTELFDHSDVEDLWWSADGRRVYFSSYAGDGRSMRLFAIPAAGGEVQQLTTGRDWLTEFSVDSGTTYAACSRENPTTPPQVAVVNLNNQQVHILVDLNPEMKNITLSPATRIEWNNKYGESGFGYLVKPLDYQPGKRYPLVVTTYGSGESFLRGGVGDEFPIQVLAANGFAVLDFNDSFLANIPGIKKGDFQRALRIWASPMASLEAALKTLDHQGIIDPERAGITGLSHGAEITVFTISHSDLFHAASVSVANGMDPYFDYMGGRLSADEDAQLGLSGLLEGQSLERWREVSAAMNMTHTRTPLLSNAPDSEFLISLQEITSLQEFGKPVEMFVYPNELHVKRQPRHRYDIYERNVDWFRFWLQGFEGKAPDYDPDQYVRWRKLREQQEWNERMRSQGKDPSAEFLKQTAPGADLKGADVAPTASELH